MFRSFLFTLFAAASASLFLDTQQRDRLHADAVNALLAKGGAQSNATHASSANAAADGVAPDPTSTTLNPFRQGATAAEMTGVKTNDTGDLVVFLTGLATNCALIVVFVVAFSFLRVRFPRVYAGNLIDNELPCAPSGAFFSWMTSSLELRIEDVVDHCGLDQAMLLEFSNFGMRLLAFLALPLLCVMGPIHWFCGGNRSGDDRLSKLGMANVVDEHPWLYYMHGVLVWFVVVAVQRFIFDAQRRFLVLRTTWLKTMPAPRATTVLIQRVPEEYCSDKKLEAYLDRIFDAKVVKSVHFVKHTGDLLRLEDEKAKHERKLQLALFKEKQTGMKHFMGSPQVDATEYYAERIAESTKVIKEERSRVQEAISQGDPKYHTSNAFVVFNTRRDAEMALKVPYTADEEAFICEIPPSPSDVIYADLKKDPDMQDLMSFVGYGLIALVFWAYMPAVIGVAYITDLDTLAKYLPVFQTLADDGGIAVMWDALMGSVALQLFISFVPTFFVLIFSFFFAPKAQSWLQHRVQNWYFWFQVVYVMLVTAVGSSVIKTVDTLVHDPTSIFYLLATTMPFATHFYLNFIPLQWVTHAQNLLRMVQFFKFEAFKVLYEEDTAKAMAEPEDQDYYGIGSRNARQSFIVALALVYCSLTPLITVLGCANCFLCRLVYGYLVVFAEIRKPDLGGVFWVTNLVNIQQCMAIYIVLMSGVLCFRDATYWPSIIAGSSGLYWYRAKQFFVSSYHWESLALEDLADKALSRSWTQEMKLASGPIGSYVQPELVE